ncbi:5-fold beta-flower protein [Umezakia ovalisporum]|jgi:hypothetical protein|uniref:Uncharacterized protein n=1 Tax=Umezakia ovalisporum FSS-43 TaxID=2740520 RepID=A0ABT6K440_9CYAN|nr:hypothetical protein [Umezakia ovalisporum]MDH6056860.1 hypothetical protein [Umezakia ovalisporum FSS-43]
MKALFASALLLGTLLTGSVDASAQSQNYKHLIHTGEIKDARGITVGTVTKDQIIKDSQGRKIAFIDGQGNLVDAKTNRKLGRMGKDGKAYFNADGQLVFTIKGTGKTCEIFDANGKKIGDVHSSLKASACALACFQDDHQHQKQSVKK